MSGIYIHIPFCKQACHYCNFHFSTTLKYKKEVVEGIVRELEMRSAYLEGSEVNSIYFGGGTPSLLEEDELRSIFETIDQFFDVNANAEVTLEANPDDLSEEKLGVLSRSQVNRLSIGVQSFHEAELEWMNRAHNATESLQCIKAAQRHGFENISVDLIFGIPMSSNELWSANLEQVSELGVPHISSYALTVEEGTALGRWVAKGREEEAKDEYVMGQFDMGIDFLESKGYEHYEISNFALPGRQAIHNSNYWRSQHYLGVGPSAHSFNGRTRSMNLANNIKYLKAINAGVLPMETEEINDQTKYNEYVMTRLRTSWGVDEKEVAPFQAHFKHQVSFLLEKGWVTESEGVFRLTREGKHFADAAAMELFID